MKTAEGRPGRVFVLKLEDGDVVPDCIESFAEEKGIKVGQVVLIGGAGSGQVVVGPRFVNVPPDPMLLPLDGAHEMAAVGVIAPNEKGRPVLHIHAALGRSGQTITGCLRPSVKTWLTGEAVLYEILDAKVVRKKDKQSGFELMEVGK